MRCAACESNPVVHLASGFCADCYRYSDDIRILESCIERAETLDELKAALLEHLLPNLS